ncbi:PIR Superfamily Protein [Plasmodium ovale curtisi]|uniref:PIR Superfamily Protein n=1 Tax=Plasmodium ovale curtisi TaxID=864141 RepID=A0A1A8WC29_PLAOA|nr:PIR Superfamily Protein [Plasmodium ovale curtisi]
MKINRKQFIDFPKKSKRFIDKSLKDNSSILCFNDDGTDTEINNVLTKYNYDGALHNLWTTVFSSPLNKCYNNGISRMLILIGLYHVLTLQLLSAEGEQTHEGGTHGQDLSGKAQEKGDDSFIAKVMGYVQTGFQCISGQSGDTACVQKIFLVLSLLGTCLSLIGAVFSLLYRFCSCFMCCRRSPRARPTNEATNNNKQLELMQMQMQQQQICNALMSAALSSKGKMSKGTKKKGNKKDGSEKKNKNSSNGANKPQRKISKDKHLYTGYQNVND